MKIASSQVDVVDVLHDDRFRELGITVQQHKLMRFGVFELQRQYPIVGILSGAKLLDFLQSPVVSLPDQNAEEGLQFGQT